MEFVGSNLANYLSLKDLKIITSSRKKCDIYHFKIFNWIFEFNQLQIGKNFKF